jgi:uncharacterized protein (DUF58 family)
MFDQARINQIRQLASRLTLKTRRSITGKATGQRSVRRRGEGFEFDELRDYQAGDSIRAVDWKSSARTQRLMVRSYYDDRNRSIMLLVDISRSGRFGSRDSLKEIIIKELGMLLSFVAQHEQDGLGALLFHSDVENFIPIKSGRVHQAFIGDLIGKTGSKLGVSSIKSTFISCLEQLEPNSLVILISDCLQEDMARLLPAMAGHHELVVLRVYDPIERQLPKKLLTHFVDPESNEMIDGTDPITIQRFRSFLACWKQEQDMLFKQHGIGCCDIDITEPYIDKLVHFFKKR